MTDGDGLGSVRRAVANDRRRFWLLVIGLTSVVATVVVIAVALGWLGRFSPWFAGGIAATFGVVVALLDRRPSRVAAPPPARLDAADELSNVAFSTRAPGPAGWKRDHGVLEAGTGRFTIRGLENSITVLRPRARLADSKWLYWQMVEVTGTLEDGEPVTLYLVGAGAPRVKNPRLREEIQRRAVRFVGLINGL